MSSTTRASAPTNEGYRSAKYSAKPDYFFGDRKKLEDWLNQIMLYFKLERIERDSRKTNTLINNTDLKGLFSSWKNYNKAVKGFYGLSNNR
ncbi:hypothetical protein LTR62_001655 [Meristemomyces frigidus]|uniref:Uncharacterized protein n=1 Tax=Meristemomyces frigidus TaxID=1508187 RepID=A0AAN7T896_9PEZI|nr:hypothetical protein LTR62_001655 [Meristemomyces frigidus]